MREMRRKKQALSKEECENILKKATSGVLALSGDDGYTYALPLSYVYENGNIYFHSAKEGHKIDAIKKHDKVSFCVIAEDNVQKEKYTTFYKSVIAFGRISIIDDKDEIFRMINVLAEKYFPEDSEKNRMTVINKETMGLCMIKLEVHNISGKCSLEYLKK